MYKLKMQLISHDMDKQNLVEIPLAEGKECCH